LVLEVKNFSPNRNFTLVQARMVTEYEENDSQSDALLKLSS